MLSSRDEAWDRVRSLETLLALLSVIEDRRRVIRAHAWREGSWQQVFEEATAMGHDLKLFRDTLSERWHELMDDAQV
jgi:uncharacterized protein (UPF0335 family)